MCCGRPHPCLVLSHHSKKITPGLFVMVCADIALGLITPAFSVALFLAGSWTWGGTCGRSRIYGISGEACGCLFFKCNIRPWATTYIVLKNVEESHMAWHAQCCPGRALESHSLCLTWCICNPRQYLQVCHLDRVDGWQGVYVQCPASWTFDDVVGLFL